MRGITSKLFVLALITIAGLIILTSCEHSKGSLKSNQAPTIQLTSYNGSIDSSNVYSDTLLYQQTIYWQASDPDGVVDGYAFRILDNNGNGVQTYGYAILDPDGWVYHYKDGANENDPNHPLGDETVSTIWTSAPTATIRFPASISQQIIRDTVAVEDSTGVIIDSIVYVSYINEPATGIPYIFEVKCIDDRGAESESEIKRFFTYSVKPSIGISTNKGELSTIDEESGATIFKDVGLGIRFVFTMIDDDPYVANGPVYFKYKLYKVDTNGNYVPDPAYPDTTTWYYAYDNGNISRQVLTRDSTYTPPLVDFGTDDYLTRIMAIGMDEAQLESFVNYRDFRVKEGFYPGTLVYNYDIFVLGDNHFVDYQEPSLEIDIPFRSTLYGNEFSTPMFIDQHGRLVAMHSEDLQIHMYWGYRGEYAENNPRNPSKTALVLDEQTGVNYLSEIMYYDIQLNGDPYYSPLFGNPADYVITDQETGEQWTRFPVNSSYAQKVTLVNLEATDPYDMASVHEFKVRAVDLQDIPDPTPAEFTFKLDETLNYNEKEGILVIDGEVHSPSLSPDDIVNAYYEDYLTDTETKETLDYEWLASSVWNSELHFGKDVLSPTDLQKYKLVIWHTENPTAPNKFWREYDIMNLYLRSGGNIIVIGGANLINIHDNVKAEAHDILEDYFGISVSSADDTDRSIRAIPGAIHERPYFVGSQAVNSDWPDVMVNTEGNWPAISTLIAPRAGMGSISYFNNGYFQTGVEVLYKTVIKEPNAEDNYAPSEDDYTAYNDRANVLRFKRNVEGQVGVQQTCYLVGFPAIYMQQDQVKEMLLKMIEDIMTQN